MFSDEQVRQTIKKVGNENPTETFKDRIPLYVDVYTSAPSCFVGKVVSELDTNLLSVLEENNATLWHKLPEEITGKFSRETNALLSRVQKWNDGGVWWGHISGMVKLEEEGIYYV